ncbi:MAG: hypothetical protein IJS89_00375 [Bacteroidaceae bacterium]|nr:hypothetical protein [Bacteroidaceae bacterium]
MNKTAIAAGAIFVKYGIMVCGFCINNADFGAKGADNRLAFPNFAATNSAKP